MWDDKLCGNVMAHSDFFLGEYSVISEILSSLQISKLIRSQISYAIHDFVTADYEIIITDTALNLSADLLFLDIIHNTKDFDPWYTFSNIFMIISIDHRSLHSSGNEMKRYVVLE